MGGSDASTVTGADHHLLYSAEPFDQARFIPGAMLAGRYRIVSLLGRGGMGDVYRAEDLKLGQPVALKFLPKDVVHRADRLTRLQNEVRVARQVSHPNVCRVYDIGEADGQHFLSMEYVDGEDLASLLRRIGRLPPDKALELARQLCAGLAAALSEIPARLCLCRLARGGTSAMTDGAPSDVWLTRRRDAPS